MMPNTGPNVSSDMTFISCVTLINTCGATYVVSSFASGKSDSGMSALAPFETAAGAGGHSFYRSVCQRPEIVVPSPTSSNERKSSGRN